MKTFLCLTAVAGLLLAALAMIAAPASAIDSPLAGKVYELRTYTANPGKMEALHARFRDHTCKLFKKHNIEVIGFWTPAEGDESKNTLIYLVAFPSVAAQKAAWQAFRDDPEWKEVKANSEKDGSLTKERAEQNLKATDYSPIR